ncbi:MAG: hypothetical protein AAF745_05980, partial [Planctomycetota bacterium]
GDVPETAAERFRGNFLLEDSGSVFPKDWLRCGTLENQKVFGWHDMNEAPEIIPDSLRQELQIESQIEVLLEQEFNSVDAAIDLLSEKHADRL